METLELVHLQLTLRCNLRCPFCGQWGQKGFAEHETAAELTPAQWLDVLAQLEELYADKPQKPDYILWGGEPLLSPAFPIVASHLRQSGNRIALVTNGSLLADFSDFLNDHIDSLYVSVDGPAQTHDRIRNRPGLYEKIQQGLSRIDHERVNVVGLFTLCEANHNVAASFPFTAAELGLKRLIVQNLIYCSSAQAIEYRNWIGTVNGCPAPHVDSWISDSFGAWVEKLPDIAREIEENISCHRYPILVTQYPAEFCGGKIAQWYQHQDVEPVATEYATCELPWKHLHIRPSGNVDFCVDHNDFTLGNVKDSSLSQLLHNSTGDLFREGVKEGRNPLCRRCPWRYNHSLRID